MSWDFLNVLGDKDDFYKSERGALKDNRTDIKYDAGDHLRWAAASLLGRGDEFSKESLLEGAAKLENEALNKRGATKKARQLIREGDSLLGIDRKAGDLKITSGMDVSEFDDRLSSAANLSSRAIETKAAMPGVDLAGVTTIGGLVQRVADRKEEKEHEVGGKFYNEKERLADKKEKDRRYYADKREARRDKKEARLDRLEQRNENRRSENKRYELEIMRLNQQDKYKAQERRDRMIMTLMSGLDNLTQAFTI